MVQVSAAQIQEQYPGLEELSYSLEFALSAILTTNILQFGWWRCRNTGDWNGFRWLLASVPLSNAMPLGVLLVYVGKVNYDPYNKTDDDGRMWKGEWWPNTPHGFTLWMLKFLGTGFMVVGVLKITKLYKKIQARWRELTA